MYVIVGQTTSKRIPIQNGYQDVTDETGTPSIHIRLSHRNRQSKKNTHTKTSSVHSVVKESEEADATIDSE